MARVVYGDLVVDAISKVHQHFLKNLDSHYRRASDLTQRYTGHR